MKDSILYTRICLNRKQKKKQQNDLLPDTQNSVNGIFDSIKKSYMKLRLMGIKQEKVCQ